MVKVSVVVPIYNMEKYLTRCLDCLINQTLSDMEIICVNNGSTDNSAKILNAYQTKYSKVKIVNTQNTGVSAARNSGVEIANGEFIGFADPDDWVDTDYYEKLFNSVKATNSEIAVSGILRVTKGKEHSHLSFVKVEETSDTNKKFELCQVPEKSYVWNKIYNLQKLKETKIKFEEGIIYEDLIWTPQVLYQLGKLVTVPDTYYHYYRHGNSLVKRKDSKAKTNLIYAQKTTEDFIKSHNIDISSHSISVKKIKFFGLTIVKIKKKAGEKQYILFNIFKFGKSIDEG